MIKESIYIKILKGFFKKHKTIKYEWYVNTKEILFPKNNNKGFDIKLSYENDYLVLCAGDNCHEHNELFNIKDKEEIKKYLYEYLLKIIDMLEGLYRIKVTLSNGKPRKYQLQHFINEKWKTEFTSFNIVWNYFGKKENKYYRNNYKLKEK